MAGNANTTLDPAVAIRVANDHRSTADDIDRQKNSFDDAVNVLDDVCDGAMMKALREARDSWMSEVNAIIADLREMAGNVDGTVQDFDEQDHANAGQIGAVGLNILKDI
ncbi:type VII secretion target [Solwaraspora sp. WMMD791]|uniref:WXG100 family type VII secretion target n=1 Tax=Solwaraspora sp. WMMD791 TaxID=3016086 RepID=UPI00249A7A55|nr:type VII secretion target [Solwaraspora sp. WMMD791]WFE25470.1 type VII secretion target [Solwaraspora sp. WMMD791]